MRLSDSARLLPSRTVSIEAITALETRREEMDRAAVSSDGTSGRPPVSSVESVRENCATWYLTQILPAIGSEMRMPSTTSRPLSVMEKRQATTAAIAKLIPSHRMLCCMKVPKASRSMVIPGSLLSQLVIELGKLRHHHREHEDHQS